MPLLISRFVVPERLLASKRSLGNPVVLLSEIESISSASMTDTAGSPYSEVRLLISGC